MTNKDVLNLALKALVLNNNEWRQLADSGDAGYWKVEDTIHYQKTEIAIKAVEAELLLQEKQLMLDGWTPLPTLNELKPLPKLNGWKPLPAEPSKEMLDAARQAPIPAVMLDSYSAMENLRITAQYKAMYATARTLVIPSREIGKDNIHNWTSNNDQ